MKSLMNVAWMSLLALSASPAGAQNAAPAPKPTIVTTRAAALMQTVRLDRLTFGPDDNFQPAPFSDGRSLLFTRKAHMNPVLEILDINRRELSSWRSNLRDVDSASVHASSGQVVFRSLERTPDGEICLTNAMSESVSCLKLLNGEKSSPFWITDTKIGFVRKERGSANVTLEVYDTRSQQSRTLNNSKLFHPSASIDGRLITWVERLARQGEQQKIQYASFDGERLGELCTPRIAWPGLSAYPRFSRDGKFLVFSHYLADTNQDGRIDGDDNSILARIPLPAKGCPTETQFPEPLTSLAENCSQPGLSPDRMIVACAFEGSLDLYALPETGVIPTAWTESELLSAHFSARTPEDRLLFLLTLAARANANSAISRPLLLRGVFGQALLMNDEAGGLEWLRELRTRGAGLSTAEAATFDKILKNGAARRSEPPGELSLTLRQSLENSLRGLAGSSFLEAVGRASTHRMIGGPGSLAKARAELMKAAARPAESDLSFLAFSHEWQQTGDLDEAPYQERLAKTKMSEPSQLIYWAKSLERMENAKNRETQLHRWANAKDLSPAVRKLLELELLAMKVQKGEKDAYLNFDKVITPVRDQSVLVRLAAYRAIHLWTASDRLQEVEWITTNLFKFIPAHTLESTYAKEYFIATSFDRGYEHIRLGQPQAALGHFYGAVVTTDNLEAHWGYLTQMVAAGREKLIDANINELKKRNFINETENLVRLYAELARLKGALPEDSAGWLSKVEKAEPRPDAFASFLRGSVRLQRILEKPEIKEDERREELEKARVELILALDGARNNERLKAQTLTNLGLLGNRAKSWGPAQKWWQERLEMPFLDEDSRFLALYLRAQALVGLQDFHQASEILDGLKLPAGHFLEAPLRHLRIQAAAYAGRHEKVLELNALSPNPYQDMNDLKRGLLVGRSLVALERTTAACQTLTAVKEGLARVNAGALPEHPSGQNPRRLRIINAGYLARCETGTTAARTRLAELQSLLQIPVEERKALAFFETSFLETRMKTQVRLWLAHGDLSNDSVAAYLLDLEAHRAAAGQFVNLGQFEALYALGSLTLTAKTRPEGAPLEELKTRMDSFLSSSRKSLTTSDLLVAQRVKMEAVRWKLDGMKADDFRRRLEASEDLTGLGARNAFLAKQVREALEWMQAL
ncbi:MAG: hypothetical protein KF767_06750 [Bdellovibrionaceae bacterium]|nr:hypothetical protein [Pseudobdellovibrionaceae bacterium]